MECIDALCKIAGDGRCLGDEIDPKDCGCDASEIYEDGACENFPCASSFNTVVYAKHNTVVEAQDSDKVDSGVCSPPAINGVNWYSFDVYGTGEIATITTCDYELGSTVCFIDKDRMPRVVCGVSRSDPNETFL